ncbi:replication-relaxation family protein [Yersinia pseudotuberculosis]|uniref:replication-relaxation family protein n=1 Tax=Yersinia pseudotuberculosis TaxID=633 RepID=UPI001F3568D4|nr:replication-relaxation family protein [Yersinia pseudotuberculosis]MCF1165454.1 hypothetical protein [Yersinia pseudotuberculosis]
MHIKMSFEERQARQERNERWILIFIASEGFSTALMLAELLGYKQPQSVYKILHRLEEKKFIRAYKMDFIGNLYLLTPTGISQLDEHAEVKNIKAHEIKPYSMEHRLAIQKCHIAMIKNRVRWVTSTGKIKKGQQKPDGVIWFTGREKEIEIAIEVELTIKTRKRYYQIYNSYISSRFKLIIYVVPNEVLKKRLENILNDILNKHPHGLRYEHNHTNMQVSTMSEFSSNLTAENSERRAAENKVRIEKAKEKQVIDQEAAEEKARARREEQERLNRKYEEEQRALFPEPPPKKKKFGLF